MISSKYLRIILIICFYFSIQQPSQLLYAQENGGVLGLIEAEECYDLAKKIFVKEPIRASAYFEEVIPVFEEHEKWDAYAISLIGQSSAEYYAGNYDKSEELSEYLKSEARENPSIQQRFYLYALNNLSQAYKKKGKWRKMIKTLKETLAGIEEQPEPDFKQLSLILNQMGGYYLGLGDYDEAINKYERSFKIWAEHIKPEKGHAAVSALSLGRAYQERENLAKSKDIFLRYLPYASPTNKIRAFYGLASIYLKEAKADSAAYYLSNGRSILVEGKKPYFQQSETLFGRYYLIKRDTLRALEKYAHAQKIRLEDPIGKRNKEAIYSTYKKIGEIKLAQKEYEESLQYFQKALCYLQIKAEENQNWRFTPKADQLENPINTVKLLKFKVEALYHLYQNQKDTAFLNIALRSVKLGAELVSQIQQLQASEGGKLQLSKEARPLIELGIEISQELYQLEGKKTYLWDGLSFAETIKARVLKEELLETEALFESKIPEGDFLEYENLKADIKFYEKQINNFNPKTYQDSIKLQKWQKLLGEKESRFAMLEESWEEKYPLYQHKKLDLPELNAQFLKEYLEDDACLLTFFWGERKLHIFAMQNAAISHYELEFGDLSTDLEQISRLLRAADMSPSSMTSFEEVSTRLYTQILSEVLSGRKLKSLHLALDGPLSYLPFEILLVERNGDTKREISNIPPSRGYRMLPYLFKQYDIRYVYAAALLGLGQQSSVELSKQLATFAPEYDGMLSLENNVRSAQQIAELLKGQAFLKKEASEGVFLAQAKDFHSLHLAMHGNANVEKPINAYLDFGGTEDSSYDGRLHVHELYTQSFHAELVSMIACDAGYGKLESGEGVMSLARAFRIAGVDNIMTSLWKADGRAAMPISQSFFEELKSGKKPSTSLQEAKLQFLQTASPDMTHPFYWATYVVMGNNQRIWTPVWQKYALWVLGFVFLGALGFFLWKQNSPPKSRGSS